MDVDGCACYSKFGTFGLDRDLQLARTWPWKKFDHKGYLAEEATRD